MDLTIRKNELNIMNEIKEIKPLREILVLAIPINWSFKVFTKMKPTIGFILLIILVRLLIVRVPNRYLLILNIILIPLNKPRLETEKAANPHKTVYRGE